MSKESDNNYNLDDYNNPLNYNLYYQCLYQMYPQMSDYYKKAHDQTSSNVNTPYVLFNTGIFDPNQQENNTLYDPNYLSGLYNTQNQQEGMEIKHEGEDDKEKEKNDVDYSKIDYNKYIDSVYNVGGGRRRGKGRGRGGHHGNHDYDEDDFVPPQNKKHYHK